MIAAVLLATSLVAAQVQTPPTPAPSAPEQQPVRGPRLGSPDLVKLGPGVMAPRLRREVKPTYPPDAPAIEGIVTMDCVVLEDGTVGDVKVTKSLDPALDRESIAVVRQWRFLPAMAEGKAVPVQVYVEMQFTLRK